MKTIKLGTAEDQKRINAAYCAFDLCCSYRYLSKVFFCFFVFFDAYRAPLARIVLCLVLVHS